MREERCTSKLSATHPGGSARRWFEQLYYKLDTYLCLRCFLLHKYFLWCLRAPPYPFRDQLTSQSNTTGQAMETDSCFPNNYRRRRNTSNVQFLSQLTVVGKDIPSLSSVEIIRKNRGYIQGKKKSSHYQRIEQARHFISQPKHSNDKNNHQRNGSQHL